MASVEQPVSDLLSVLSSLLDKSGELNDETTRLARVVQSRRAPVAAGDIRNQVAAGLDTGSVSTLSTPVAGKQADGRTSLVLALAECREACSSLDALHEYRDQVVEARVAAMESREASLAAARTTLRTTLAEARVEADARQLQALVAADAKHSSAAVQPGGDQYAAP